MLILPIAAAVFAAGCSGSRWAKADPKYARKYHEHTGDPTKVVKQAIDARHVAGRDGFYAYGAGGNQPASGEFSVGKFLYVPGAAGMIETRGGVRGLAVEGGGWAAGGELGLRAQLPSRLAPFVGVSGFLGAAPQDYINGLGEPGFEDESIGTTVAGAVSPEVGLHFWLTPAWRLSASATHTYIDFEGPPSGEYTTVGLTLARLDVPWLRRTREQPAAICSQTIPASLDLPEPPAASPSEPLNPESPYTELLAP